jgi:hypothetical protein
MNLNFNNLPSQETNSQEANQEPESEQVTQIIKAILEGKYSWACVLILRFYGYNPLHYIPYRTYKRLVKQNRYGENCQNTEVLRKAVENASKSHAMHLEEMTRGKM